jgi:hypothetical protein
MGTRHKHICNRVAAADYSQSNVALAALLALVSLALGCAGLSNGKTSTKNTTATAPTITTASLPNGTVGVAYSSTLSATGGTAPYTWVVSSGSLPAGLSLSSVGKISGTPSAAGATNFTVQVTDAAKSSASAQFALTVRAQGSAPTVVTSGLPGGTKGMVYSSAVSAAGGTPPYSWGISGGSLPGGLSLSAEGEISGIPSAVGPATFTVKVTDASKHSSTAQLGIVVGSPGAPGDTLTVFEVDGVTQTNRPVRFGRIFQQGEIAQCPQPVSEGGPVSDYQSDVKNRWPDGSVKFAIISFIQNLAPSSAAEFSFQNTVSCNNTGYLGQAQMTGFNGGNWGGQIVVTPAGGTAVTTDAKTMLAASDPSSNVFGDCKNDYWLQGPVVTAVILQDCTSASAHDFGWTWNGSTMTSPVTGNASTASLHPMFILYFYPSINSIEVSAIIEDPWPTRIQDQSVSLAIKTGGTPTTVWSKPTFTMNPGQRFRKTFWSGTAPGKIRTDHNFEYLKSTRAFPNYDPNVTVSTSSDYVYDGATSWSTWSAGDRGDIGGNGGLNAISQDFSSNSEGAPIQREDLLYLYNMGSCGTANSECAKAWDMLTGEIGAIDTSLSAGSVPGGAGTWNNVGNIPYHMRESRPAADGVQSGSTNWFYCDNFAEKNARTDGTNPVTGVSGCGNNPAGEAFGKPFSKHTHSDDQWGGPGYWGGIINSVIVGTATTGGWAIGGCNHWQDWNYAAYLETGDYYYLENNYQAASLCLMDSNPDPTDPAGGARFFSYMSPQGAVLREWAWGIQAVERAAFVAPDGTSEASYYLAQLNSNLEAEEGFMGITGTASTPSDTTCSGATCNHNPTSANRWNWGRATGMSQCFTSGSCTTIPLALHMFSPGACPLSGAAPYVRSSVTSAFTEYWFYSYINVVLAELRESGYTQAQYVSQMMQQGLEERVLDSTFNPYLVAAYGDPVKNAAGGTSCNGAGENTDPFIATYVLLLSAYDTSITSQCTFNAPGNNNNLGSCGSNSGSAWNQQIPCGDHGYSLLARAASSFLQEFGASSNDANCPGGTCTAAAAWGWLDSHAPFFSNAVTNSQTCSAYWAIPDSQIKYALAPR